MIKLHISNRGAALLLISVFTSNGSIALNDGQSLNIRLSDPVETTATSETFGAPFPDSLNPISLQQLVVAAEDLLDQEVAVSTTVAKVCQKKGCFFIAQDGATTLRVSFKDYGFFLPTDSGGKQVDLFGVLTHKRISQKAADHFAKDLGTTDTVIAAGLTYEFVASSVKIPLH